MCAQESMQNQVNINPESHFIIPAGGLVNLSELIATTKTTAGRQRDTHIHHLYRCSDKVTEVMNKEQMDGM